jgi:inhibitor of cysteine peptidase
MAEIKPIWFVVLGLGMIVAVVAFGMLDFSLYESYESDELKKFESADELKAFLKEHVAENGYYAPGIRGEEMMDGQGSKDAAVSVPPMESAAQDSSGAGEYSTTNIQVMGVDEPDFVKNDGKYIYILSGQRLVIVDAYPANNARIVSDTAIKGNSVELFLEDDRLVVFSELEDEVYIKPPSSATPVPVWRPVTHAFVYSLRDRAAPEMVRDIAVSGRYYDARCIGTDVYLVTSDSVSWRYDEVLVPEVQEGEGAASFPDIYYVDLPYYNYVFHTISSFDLLEGEKGSIEAESFLIGYGSTLYVSKDNLYIAYKKQVPYRWYESPLDAEGTDSSGETSDRTIIHRFAIHDGSIDYKAMGEVPGHLLNQFSLDQWNSHLRVATTVEDWNSKGSIQYNNVYVLNGNLEIVGKLEYLAPDERIYSTRFVGDRLYMVTFKRIDPLFVIDLSNPAQPGVLGELKIPGYSDYLHPYDADHIIGIGKETEENEWGGISIAGLKIALFDVSDVNNPALAGKVEIGAAGTDSEALYDHKAFLFDKDKNLLVIPVREVKRVPLIGGKYESYTQRIWQGAYVFGVDPATGFTLKGTVTHSDDAEPYYYWGAPSAVKRSLYMDDVLYTVSSEKILMTDLGDMLTYPTAISLPGGVTPPWYDYRGVEPVLE